MYCSVWIYVVVSQYAMVDCILYVVHKTFLCSLRSFSTQYCLFFTLNSLIGSATSPAPLAAPAFDTADLAGTSFRPTPSLHHLSNSFEARRVASSEKLLDLLTQVYPNMTVEEATRLTAKI